MKPRKEEWALTQEAFDLLLTHLDADRDRAGKRYEELRERLMKFFECHGGLSPGEAADQTIDRVARRLHEGEPIQNLSSYSVGVARLILMEGSRTPIRDGGFQDTYPTTEPSHDGHISDARTTCFERCFGALPTETQQLLTDYYQGDWHAKVAKRKEVVSRLGIEPAALRNRVRRVRIRLENCFQGCLKRQGTETTHSSSH